jgi:hypothetical protein
MVVLQRRSSGAGRRPHGLEDLSSEDRKRRILELLISHVSCNDLVVLAHALDHQVLDQFLDAQLELVERIRESRPHDLIALAGSFLDLLKEEPILLRELCAKSLVN